MAPFSGPSHRTGAQTPKKRKPGGRVNRADAFGGGKSTGRTLNEGVDEDADSNDEERKKGAGYGKRASSQRAKEERAAAAERRLKEGQQNLGHDQDVDQSIPSTAVEQDDLGTVAEPIGRRKRRRLDRNNRGSAPDRDDMHATSSDDNMISLSGTVKDTKLASTESSLLSSDDPSPVTAYKRNRKGALGTEVVKEMNRRKKEAIGLDQAHSLGRPPASILFTRDE